MSERAASVGVEVVQNVAGYDVTVPVFRDGRRLDAVVAVTHDKDRDVFTVALTGELLDTATEGVTVAVQMAFRAIAEARRG